MDVEGFDHRPEALRLSYWRPRGLRDRGREQRRVDSRHPRYSLLLPNDLMFMD